MNLLIGMFVQHEVAFDALYGVTCVTMPGFVGIVSDTDSEVSTANVAPIGAYGSAGCDGGFIDDAYEYTKSWQSFFGAKIHNPTHNLMIRIYYAK